MEPERPLREDEQETQLFASGPPRRTSSWTSTSANPPPAASGSFSPGDIAAGRFRIVRFLGRGGMGEVYEVEDSELHERVAIKTLRPEIAGDERTLAQFKREIQLARRVTHPNVCRIFDLFRHQTSDAGEVTFLTMEFLNGETLSQWLKRAGRMDTASALPILKQMASGLDAAHQAGVIHRDFKSANVMLLNQSPGEVRAVVTDFGLARPASDVDNAATLTGAGGITGTPAYMAPEQIQGMRITAAVDIYALGVVLFELVTGKQPFTGNTAMEIAFKRLQEPPERPGVLIPDLDPRWESAILRCLERDPNERFEKAADVCQAVISGPVPSSPRRLLHTRIPRRAWWLAGAAALAAAVLLVTPDLPTGSKTADSFTLYQTASDLLKKKYRKEYLDRSVQALEQAIAANPNHAASYAALAEAYVARHQAASDQQWLGRAREAATRAVELNPDLAMAHVAAGMAAVAGNSFEAAEASLRRALDLDPRSARARQWQGRLRERQNRLDDAAKEYQAAMTLAPADWEAANALGSLQHSRQRYTEAAEAWEKARTASPDNPLVHRNVAIAYHMLDRYEDAAASLQRALEIEPSAVTYNNLGTLRFFQGHYRDAARALEKAVEMNANRYLYWGNLGDAYRWAPGERAKSAEAYKSALRLAKEAVGKDKPARGRIALYLAKSGDSRAALQQLGEIPTNEWDATMHYRAAVVHELGGRRDAALAELRAAVDSGYALREIANDPELIDLRNDLRYHRLLVNKDIREKKR